MRSLVAVVLLRWPHLAPEHIRPAEEFGIERGGERFARFHARDHNPSGSVSVDVTESLLVSGACIFPTPMSSFSQLSSKT